MTIALDTERRILRLLNQLQTDAANYLRIKSPAEAEP